MRVMTGWHVMAIFLLGFGTIIAVNVTLAVNAVRTFPGLEVKNSYVASQGFDGDRRAQEALNWQAHATLDRDQLTLHILEKDRPVSPKIEKAVFGRATSVSADQTPEFAVVDGAFVAKVQAGPGNWNLRIVARAGDGTEFKQRLIVEVLE